MKEPFWESSVCWLCDRWWVLLTLLVLAVTAYFTRRWWLPSPPVIPTAIPFEVTIPVDLGTGDVQVTLLWATTDDLDLWVTDPTGFNIYYGQPRSPSGGQLDVDANANCVQNRSQSPVENIYWPAGEAPDGTFVVRVNFFKRCTTQLPVNFTVRVLVDGETTVYQGSISQENEMYYVSSFER